MSTGVPGYHSWCTKCGRRWPDGVCIRGIDCTCGGRVATEADGAPAPSRYDAPVPQPVTCACGGTGTRLADHGRTTNRVACPCVSRRVDALESELASVLRRLALLEARGQP